jgi:hypothetical protein
MTSPSALISKASVLEEVRQPIEAVVKLVGFEQFVPEEQPVAILISIGSFVYTMRSYNLTAAKELRDIQDKQPILICNDTESGLFSTLTRGSELNFDIPPRRLPPLWQLSVSSGLQSSPKKWIFGIAGEGNELVAVLAVHLHRVANPAASFSENSRTGWTTHFDFIAMAIPPQRA